MAVVAEGLAGDHDAAVEGCFGDVAFGPNVVEEFLLGEGASRVLDEEGEHLEDLGFKRDGTAGTTEFEAGDIEFELIEGVHPSPDDHGDRSSDHDRQGRTGGRGHL
jgi:hypothetical protein